MVPATSEAVLDLEADVVTLARQLVDIPSVSHHEQVIADAVERELRARPHLDVVRHGHTIVARTHLGRDERVVIAGHLDTVPANDNLPSRLADGLLHGLGSCDMKGGDAVILRLAAAVGAGELTDRKSTRLNSSHIPLSRMPSSA